MTEAEWLDDLKIAREPDCARDAMLDALAEEFAGASLRKLRLYAVACGRQVLDQMADPRSRQTVEIAEQHADGQVSNRQLEAARENAYHAYENQKDCASGAAVCLAGAAISISRGILNAGETAMAVIDGTAHSWFEVARLQCHLLRDIFGNPFRPPPAIDPAWLRWHDATIPRLAQQMYDVRDFVAMPILADALEEAGCTDAAILEHCRGPGPHVRGCWVVDLLLAKE